MARREARLRGNTGMSGAQPTAEVEDGGIADLNPEFWQKFGERMITMQLQNWFSYKKWRRESLFID
jgi:hypothetical protein